MRYIPNNNLKIPDDWIKLANKAKDELINSDEERRAEIIKKKSAVRLIFKSHSLSLYLLEL